MGKITNVLNKVQESRQVHQDQKIPHFSHMKDAHHLNSKMVAITILSAGILTAVIISNEIHNLGKTVQMQKKRIDDLTTFLMDTKGFSDSQIHNFNFRLMNETEDRKIQVNKLSLIDNVYYLNLIKSIHADIHQINYLEEYAKYLDSKIDKISTSEKQAQAYTGQTQAKL